VKSGAWRGIRSWWPARLCWGKGLAAEAARQAIVVAREREPARPVVARTRPGNTAAARLALAIGMVRSAELDGDGFIAYTALTAP
jgi:RimJ/RimL family protein N-acetyltransferase